MKNTANQKLNEEVAVKMEELKRLEIFEVHGNSMDNGLISSYPDKTIVYAKEVSGLIDTEAKRQDYVIFTKDHGLLVKRVKKVSLDGSITLSSLNPEYKDFIISSNEVVKALIIVKKELNYIH